ncbi:carbon starvation protein CstA [Pseudoalteromonas sp. SWN166]|uniref:carbon starvation protein CstA n=1 Tax=Pseudoalteromonas sp. SWN166 TaxID=2792061 RepID=UPI0018CCE265|nr:carbon starvation protein CstA [Pseudoalteromonas sp. SWN166]MBH0038015.1 carbon starvation protein CstA [Pseudoalteromonas sp. SWN166]
MRTLQLLGFILATAGFILGYVMLAPIDGEASDASAGGAGIGIMFMVLPMLGWSALILVPTSVALFYHKVRERTYFRGNFWLNLWKVNLVISFGYIAVVLYFAYIWFKDSIGN